MFDQLFWITFNLPAVYFFLWITMSMLVMIFMDIP